MRMGSVLYLILKEDPLKICWFSLHAFLLSLVLCHVSSSCVGVSTLSLQLRETNKLFLGPSPFTVANHWDLPHLFFIFQRSLIHITWYSVSWKLSFLLFGLLFWLLICSFDWFLSYFNWNGKSSFIFSTLARNRWPLVHLWADLFLCFWSVQYWKS